MRIAIYARVSTDDKGQDPENQLRQLRQWCANAGHGLVHEYVDHENELVRNILLALLASLAKVEAQKISERTRAGMARAKAQGKRIGRPSIAPKLRQQIAQRIAAGETPYAVAKALGIDRHTAAKYA
jgi:DNA invertase Pin-like site-specific DNA recombinase